MSNNRVYAKCMVNDLRDQIQNFYFAWLSIIIGALLTFIVYIIEKPGLSGTITAVLIVLFVFIIYLLMVGKYLPEWFGIEHGFIELQDETKRKYLLIPKLRKPFFIAIHNVLLTDWELNSMKIELLNIFEELDGIIIGENIAFHHLRNKVTRFVNWEIGIGRANPFIKYEFSLPKSECIDIDSSRFIILGLVDRDEKEQMTVLYFYMMVDYNSYEKLLKNCIIPGIIPFTHHKINSFIKEFNTYTETICQKLEEYFKQKT